MSPTIMSMGDVIGALLGFIFTLFVFSYIVGDNFFFRLTSHIFIGVAAGYVIVVTFYNIIMPQLLFPFVDGNQDEKLLAGILLVPSVLLLMKISPRLSRVANPVMALLVGIGAAAAIGGATTGTLFPQTTASTNLFQTNNIINASIILIGTLSTLIYFQFYFGRRDHRPSSLSQLVKVLGGLGKIFIAITFGALFAGVYIAALTAFIERVAFLWAFIKDLLLPSLI